MDTSGLSGLQGAALALEYATDVEKLAQDQKRAEGAAVVRLIEGAGNPQPLGPDPVAPVDPDGRGARVNIKI